MIYQAFLFYKFHFFANAEAGVFDAIGGDAQDGSGFRDGEVEADEGTQAQFMRA
jgi:hypothetical protein